MEARLREAHRERLVVGVQAAHVGQDHDVATVRARGHRLVGGERVAVVGGERDEPVARRPPRRPEGWAGGCRRRGTWGLPTRRSRSSAPRSACLEPPVRPLAHHDGREHRRWHEHDHGHGHRADDGRGLHRARAAEPVVEPVLGAARPRLGHRDRGCRRGLHRHGDRRDDRRAADDPDPRRRRRPRARRTAARSCAARCWCCSVRWPSSRSRS